jgi:hypothetical protein
MISPGLPLLLAVVGTMGLANSWIVQNRELTRAYEDVSRLQRSQLVIDTDQIARDQWLIAMDQEIAKEHPNEELLAATAHGALQGFLMWQTHMEGRVTESPDEYKKELAARDLMLAQAQKLANNKDYKSLMAALQKITTMSHALHTTDELDKQFFAAVDAANDQVAEIETRVRFWYVFGTTLLLLSSVLASVLLELTLRRMERGSIPVKAASSNRRKG